MPALTRRAFLSLSLSVTASTAASLLLRRVARAQGDPAAITPLIIDAHIDFGWNTVNYGRDYRQSALQLRAQEANTPTQRLAGRAMVGLPELLAGGVALVIGAIFTIPRRLSSTGRQLALYDNDDQAEAFGRQMLQVMIDLTAGTGPTGGAYMIVQTVSDLETVLATWAPGAPEAARRVGIVIGMEGADPIRRPADLGWWFERGLRLIGLSWGATRYAGGNVEPGGLTDLGRELLAEMARYGVILDTAHLAEQAFWDLQTAWPGRFVCTHGQARHFMQGQRAFTDDQIKALAARNGVLGIGMYDGFYTQNRVRSDAVVLDDVINAIDYVAQLTGSCDYIALGSDFDGGFGAERAPVGFDTIADLTKIAPALRTRGFSEDHVNRIMYGNWLRVLRESLPT